VTKLLCTGDWHLGAGTAYGRAPGDRLVDQAEVVQRIAALAVERNVDGVLLAGDLLEGPAATPEQLAVIADFVEACPCPILAVSGNGVHDLAMRETNGLAIFDRLDGITVSSRPDVYVFAGCAVATLPWVSPARLVAARGGGDRDEVNAETAELLVQVAARGREDCDRVAPGCPAILLAHWSVSGAALPAGLPTDTLREPVIPADALDELGFDHVVLGHIHHGQSVGERGFYVGSPLPLNFGEGDDLHGVVILHTDEREAIDYYAAEFVPIPSRSFVTLERDLTVEADPDVYVDGLDFSAETSRGEIDGAVVRLRFTATAAQMRALDVPAAIDALYAAGAHVVKPEPKPVHENRARVTDVERPDEISEAEWLDRYLALTDTPEDAAADVRAVFAGYQETNA
jgi:DNA repair exonuclease SbcCD nuclease subunit